VTPAELLGLLEEFHREKAGLLLRHEAVARVVAQYEINNTYQYVIQREEQHQSWVRDALLAAGGREPSAPAPEPAQAAAGVDGQRALTGRDADALEAFVAGWSPRVAAVKNARHRLMLDLVLGEMLEQARFFRQAAGGRVDMLGRRTGGEQKTPGGVLPSRWVE
jgi:hypothetical protein